MIALRVALIYLNSFEFKYDRTVIFEPMMHDPRKVFRYGIIWHETLHCDI